MADINWRPIDEMPDALKDGREVLLWAEAATCANFVTYAFEEVDGSKGNWHDDRGSLGHLEPTHFAEIGEPNG
jgi:hypothetical protein